MQLSDDKIEEAPLQWPGDECDRSRLDGAVPKRRKQRTRCSAEVGIVIDYQEPHSYHGMGAPLRKD